MAMYSYSMAVFRTPSCARLLPRRGFLAGIAAGAAIVPSLARASDQFVSEWEIFRSRFVTNDGRVVDTGNGGISHSEGQGYGLLFSLRAGDRGSFDRILDWTDRELRSDQTGLHAWRYDPTLSPPVSDTNNATDGDLAIAWALIEAGRQWQWDSYTQDGLATANGILRSLTVRAGGSLLLLPGAHGFDSGDGFTLNPSYYMFPAFPALAAALPDPAWEQLASNGLALLSQARFGRWNLPADWFGIDRQGGSPTDAAGREMQFSYDAVRVPLFLAWAGLDDHPALVSPASFWQANPGAPASVDLAINELGDDPASSGMHAIRQVSTGAAGFAAMPDRLPSVRQARDYYSAALSMLAQMALADRTL